jgi:peptide/nickel transport system substrate-binding protein
VALPFRRRQAARTALAPRALAVVLAAALQVACRDREAAAPAAPAPPPPTTLTVATNADISGVNELVASATRQLDQDVLSAMFLHLAEEQPDFQQHPPTFAPQLARSWDFSPDRLALTFHLRDDVRWSDGVPVTADDVRFTWQAQTSEAVGWPSSYLKESIRDVEVVDPQTVRFHFLHAYPNQLIDVNEGFVLPKHAWSQLPFEKWAESGDWFRDHLVVDGPFTLERWKPQEEVVLRANPRYFETGKPRLQRVVFRVVPDDTARLQELLGGAAQLVDGVPADRAGEVERAPGRRVESVWARQYNAIVWNTRKPPLDDPAVRRALTLAIDRQGLVEALWHGRARVGDSPILSTVWAHPADLHPWPYDPAAARRLLESRGFRDADGDGILERGGKALSIELSTTTNQQRRDAVVLIQDQLKRAGVAVTSAFREPSAQRAKLTAHEFDGALTAWGIDTSLDLRYGFDSRDPDGTNWGRYENPEVDRLLDLVDHEPDRSTAGPQLARIQHLIHEDQPYTFLWEPPRLIGLDARLQATPSALSTFTGLEDWAFTAAAPR